jgi:hypothetical protein
LVEPRSISLCWCAAADPRTPILDENNTDQQAEGNENNKEDLRDAKTGIFVSFHKSFYASKLDLRNQNSHVRRKRITSYYYPSL